MARFIKQGLARANDSGAVSVGATITVNLAGTSTAATIYTALSGGSAVAGAQITTDSNGYYRFYVDNQDYAERQLFDLVLDRSGLDPVTYPNVDIIDIALDVINVKAFLPAGFVTDGSVDYTPEIDNAFASLTEFSCMYFPSGHYLYAGTTGYTLQNIDNIKIIGNNTKITQPVETTDVRSTTKRTFALSGCDNVTIEGFNLVGQHLHATVKDNAFQTGILLDTCNKVRICDVTYDQFLRGLYIDTCTDVVIDDAGFSDSYVGFTATDSSNIRVTNSTATDCHYFPEGADNDAKSAGQGFLFDQCTHSSATNCISYRGGSECFRMQHSTVAETFVKFIDCTSIESRRYGMSIRGSVAGHCGIKGGDIVDTGLSSVWDDTPYFAAPVSTVVGILLDSDVGINNTVKSVNISFPGGTADYGILHTGTTSETGLTLDDVTIDMDAATRGIQFQNDLINSKIINCTINIATPISATYGIDIPPGSDTVKLDNNIITAAYDGMLIYGTNHTITNNTIKECERHGVHCLSTDTYIVGNHIENAGLTAYGAGIKVAAADCVVGVNYIKDKQGSPTMDKAFWATAAATGLSIGAIQEYGTSTGARLDTITVADFVIPLYGKALSDADSTAGDLAALIVDHNDLLAKLRAKNILDS